MPSGQPAWHYAETLRGGDNLVGAQPQASATELSKNLPQLQTQTQAISMPPSYTLPLGAPSMPNFLQTAR